MPQFKNVNAKDVLVTHHKYTAYAIMLCQKNSWTMCPRVFRSSENAIAYKTENFILNIIFLNAKRLSFLRILPFLVIHLQFLVIDYTLQFDLFLKGNLF